MPVGSGYALAVCLGMFSTCLPISIEAGHDLGGSSGVKKLPVGHGPSPVQLGKHPTQHFVPEALNRVHIPAGGSTIVQADCTTCDLSQLPNIQPALRKKTCRLMAQSCKFCFVGDGRLLAEVLHADTNMSMTFTAEQAKAQHPQFHITPQFGWMNDPNGMFQLGALYHVFFQYNPAAGKAIKSAVHNAC